jgi:hypothetical protein
VEPASQPPAGAAERARRQGPLPYSAWGPGRGPALPPASELAAWEADAVDAWWDELGRPDPFTLVEIGAGDGTRAAGFIARGPECLGALRYVLVDADPWLREQHRVHLPTESPILVLGPVGPDEDEDGPDDEWRRAVAGIGPLITSLPEPPVLDGPAVVLAVGSTSRLPSDRLEWRDGRWWEIRLAAAAAPTTGVLSLSELPVPLDDDRATAAAVLAGGAARPDGARYAQLNQAVEWLTRTLRVAPSGRLAVIDRWTEMTRPLAPGEVPPLALNQLASIRKPIEAAPVDLFSELSMVSWRLG